MPHPEQEHSLRIQLATALRERDEAREQTERWLRVVEKLRENLNVTLLERDGLKEALAAARRECEELRESLLVGVATHGEPCSKGEDCQFMVEARVALAAPACLGAPRCLFASLRAHSIDCPMYPLAAPGAASGEEGKHGT